MLTLRTIGRYRITGRLGMGGFAAVWLAEDPLLDARVAIKVLSDNFSGDADIRARFIQEARLLRRIKSPHVITVYDIGETESGQPYFVMEYAVRGTLAARLDAARKTRIRPSVDDIRTVVDALSQGLRELHDEGIVHRDVKPGNLLLRASAELDREPREVVLPDETIMLGDLGLAKVIEENTRHLTIGGGTLGYAAPEQLEPNARVDQRADVFGATAVLAEVVTGQIPPVGTLPDFSGVDLRMATVLTRGLSREPAHRYPQVTDWAAEATAALVPTQRVEPAPLDPPPGDRYRTVAYVPPATEHVRTAPGNTQDHVRGGPPVRARHRRRSRWRVLAVVFMLSVGGAFGGRALLNALDGGHITGPDTLLVGQAGVFVADSQEQDTTTWRVDPPDTPAARRGDDLIVTPDSAGDIMIVLEVREAGGTARTTETRTVTAVDNDSGLAIDGPARAVVGENTTYTAVGTDASDAVWTTPDGSPRPGAEITINGDSPGPITLELAGQVNGEPATVQRTIMVVDE